MKKVFLASVLSGFVQQALGSTDSVAQEEIESAWLAFSNTRGEASLILGDVEHPSANDIFRIIPDVSEDSLNEEKLQLGFDLFNEGRLSRDGSVACASCHIGMLGGVDRNPLPFGIGRARGKFNAPTVFNAALNFRQFWDGRALTLQEQALGPIENPIEFGHDVDGAVAVLKSIPAYVNAFDKFYPDGITAANLGDAIAYYETMKFTGLASPFLRQFEEGEEGQEAMSRQARLGQQRFVEVGCASCHNGINLGGNSYQQLGVAEPWYGPNRPAGEADSGLAGRTGRELDRHVFKVPTLHNVAATGPWMHDGSITSLQQAVDRMARHQLGRYLENNEIDDIVAFLRSLGDSQSIIGDCSASGNYTIIMDCSINPAAPAAGQSGEEAVPDIAPVALPDPATLAEQHRQEYAEALNRVAEAPERIHEEMRRIRSGSVMHYDFLQYQHIEMLRHARALSFPPAAMEQAQRKELLTKAAEWQQTAEQYELIIADFLRTQAVANSATANIQDLLRLLSVVDDENTRLLLAQAEQTALAFYKQPDPATQLSLERAAQALESVDLNTRHFEEFQRQVRMLLENVPGELVQ
ncbi:MAG: c-type cytochrome [Gammaproteobacteria bacterium]|nr:c-type cytochrome [Gammaproteobacteria bacterium]